MTREYNVHGIHALVPCAQTHTGNARVVLIHILVSNEKFQLVFDTDIIEIIRQNCIATTRSVKVQQATKVTCATEFKPCWTIQVRSLTIAIACTVRSIMYVLCMAYHIDTIS